MILPLFSAFAATTLCLLLLLKTPLAKLVLDHPNHRSLHKNITPRTGGLAIMVGVLCGWGILGQVAPWGIPVAMLVLISLIDDMGGLKVRWRLIAQLAVGAATIVNMMPDVSLWQTSVLVLAVVWMLNLYNFMDGSDGLAGGMAIIGFGAYAIAASEAGHTQLMALCAPIAVASLAFLLFNFHPARIFMGDAGSIPLGFLAGALGIFGWQQDVWPLWFPVLVFSAFILDASLTLTKRAVRGEKVWQAHRSHYYQRLVQMGWGHRKTALIEYVLMLATSGSAILLLRQPLSWICTGLACWVLVYAVLAYATDRAWKNFNRN